MPKDNIDAAIKRASGKDAESYSEGNDEGKGPHGVLVFVECATDNSTPTVAKVKSYFNKAGLKRFPTSPVEFTEEQLDDIEKLLAKIEEDDDVQYVFTNIA